MGKRAATPAETALGMVIDPEGATPADDDLAAVEEQILAAADATDRNVTWDIRIYKLDKAAGNAEEYMFSVLPSELEGLFERVRDSEGTGTYRMRAYRKANGRNGVFKQNDFRIRAPSKPQAPAEKPSDTAAILQTITAAMKENSDRMERLMREMISSRVQPETQRTNPLEDMERMSNILKNLRDDQPPRAPETDATQVFVKALELADKFATDRSGGGGGETNMWDIAKSFLSNLPSVAALAQAGAAAQTRLPPQSRPGAPARPPQVPHSNQAPPPNIQPAPAQAPPAQPQASDQQAAMKDMLQYLITRAQRNSDPGFYADWLTENVDGEIIHLLLSQADPVTMAVAFDPRVASYRQWFDQLIAELRQMVNMSRDHSEASADAIGSDTASDIPNGNSGRLRRDGGNASDHVPLGQGWQENADNP